MSRNESSGDTNKNMSWMYEGPKSDVNREDYLLGKKIDKNYELFSDVVVKDKAEDDKEELFRKGSARSATSSQQQQPRITGPSKTSVLELTIVRTEDPLVALKMREEQRKRDVLDNPLLKMKAQRLLKEAYEKQMTHMKGKKAKKEEKHKRAKSSDSSTSDREMSKHAQKKSRTSNSSEHRRHSPVDHHKKESSSRKKGEGSRRDERNRQRSPRDESSSHRQPQRERLHHRSKEPSHSRPRAHSPVRTEPHKDSKAAEMEAKRLEMMSNAKWRDDVRNETIEKAAEKLRKEEEELEKANPAAFLKPLLGSGTNAASVEERLQSNKKNLQRSHDYMEKSFVSRK